jgi:hypothetical protein
MKAGSKQSCSLLNGLHGVISQKIELFITILKPILIVIVIKIIIDENLRCRRFLQ